MHRLFFENVRCFFTQQSVPLRPLTLLVGENSSGKSTFLALVRLAWDLCQGVSPMDLNEEPFLLGTYDQVASSRRGRSGRAQQFCIGTEVIRKGPRRRRSAIGRAAAAITIQGRFVRQEGQPHLREWILEAAPFRITILREEPEKPPRVTLQAPSGTMEIVDFPMLPLAWQLPGLLRFLSYWQARKGGQQEGPTIVGDVLSPADLVTLEDLALSLHHSLGERPYAFAPIRTRPRRTYDPLKEIADPEGSHVPMVLAKTLTSDTTASVQLRKAIDTFGRASGLFTDVNIRRMGYKEGDPFQLQVKIADLGVNVVDVGYGVSQILPLIVDTIRGPAESTFLLQQPEVHLHPRAQAELGSFLATLAKQQQKRFVIETHSDAMIDRIRMDIRDGKHLTPEEVVILYFERTERAVQIHTMDIDRFGNLIGAPPSYRQFFLGEERRLLGDMDDVRHS